MNAKKNKQISETLSKTRAKRLTQNCKTFDLKIVSNKLNPSQKEALTRSFLEAKWLYNNIIASDHIKEFDTKTKTVQIKLSNDEFETRELKILGSQIKQSILTQVKNNLKSLSIQKMNGRKIGRLRFATNIKSLDLKQYGNSYRFKSATKVNIQGIPGYVRVRGSSQLIGYELANAKLVKQSSGYHLIVTAFKNKSEVIDSFQPDTKIGLDMGVKTHVTFSNGEKCNILIGETERLKHLQRKLSKKVKGSNNYNKTCDLINKQYEKMGNKKNDAANKLVHNLLQYEYIFMQDENLRNWVRKNGWVKAGKRLHHSILGRVKAKLIRNERVIVLSRFVPTTQLCGNVGCGTLNKHGLNERVYFCSCGYSMDRDVHAALNMLRLGLEIK